jgi:small GTP-binding protein
MPPVVAIAGRPNVGKSTLFNRLAGRRTAIVSDTPGVTRDRKEADAMLRGRLVRLVDTAGLEESAPETLAGRMHASSTAAVGQADLVVFVIDARAGLTSADRHFAQWLRRQDRPVLLVANKAEGRAGAEAVIDAYSLGLGEALAVSAEHGEGISNLMAEIADRLPPEAEAAEEADAAARPLKLAIVGRPNAGKSTLLNRLLGEERMITGPEPGLTRDAVASLLVDDEGRRVEIVDTAGLRRRARIEAPLEKLSVAAALGALKMAEVVVLTVDASEGELHDQDLQLAKLIEREGRAGAEQVGRGGRSQRDEARHHRPAGTQPGTAAWHSGGDAVGADGGGDRRAAAGGAAGLRCMEHKDPDRRVEPVVRAGAGTPPGAAGERAAAEAALHHAGQGAAADLRGVRHTRRTTARGLPALPGEQSARVLRAARHADPPAAAGHQEPVRAVAGGNSRATLG